MQSFSTSIVLFSGWFMGESAKTTRHSSVTPGRHTFVLVPCGWSEARRRNRAEKASQCQTVPSACSIRDPQNGAATRREDEFCINYHEESTSKGACLGNGKCLRERLFFMILSSRKRGSHGMGPVCLRLDTQRLESLPRYSSESMEVPHFPRTLIKSFGKHELNGRDTGENLPVYLGVHKFYDF